MCVCVCVCILYYMCGGYLPFGAAGYNRNEIRRYPRYQSRHCDRFLFFFFSSPSSILFFFYFLYAHPVPFFFFFISHGNRLGRPPCASHFSLAPTPLKICVSLVLNFPSPPPVPRPAVGKTSGSLTHIYGRAQLHI